MLSSIFAATVLLSGVWANGPGSIRPECASTVNVQSTEPTILNFDNIAIRPCDALRTTDAVGGLVFTNALGQPAPINNASSTANCHESSSGGGPFGYANSWPNAVEAENAVLNLVVANGSSFSFLGTTIMIQFDRTAYIDNDPLVIARATGYDACGNVVGIDTQAFYNVKRGARTFSWNVTAPEDFVNLQKVTLSTWWWYLNGNGVPAYDLWYTYYDDITYLIDA